MLKREFVELLKKECSFSKEAILLGRPIFNGEILSQEVLSAPLSMITRHGLITGATGTGKTKSLQIIAEELSKKGVPSLLMDLKGDLSGLALGNEDQSQKLKDRQKSTQFPWNPQGFPVEFLSISNERGIKLKTSVEKFGSLLLSQILELNQTQASILSVVFKYCADHKIELSYLKDLYEVLRYLIEDSREKLSFSKEYGNISSSSLGTILRKILSLQQEGGDEIFGKPLFDVKDFISIREGLGVINILRLRDIQQIPKVFSTFMLGLLTTLYDTLQEEGDSEKPKLVFFIDEAHLIFKNASKELLDKIEMIVKLIRSKGIGIYFCTQLPGDVPDGILSQLGLKIQHALRGVTAKDRKDIKKAIENYPTSKFYKSDELISQLGIGEALISTLDEKGVPSALVHTYLRVPYSRMGVLSQSEIDSIMVESSLREKYDATCSYSNEESDSRLEKFRKETETFPKKQDEFFTNLMKNALVKDLIRIMTRELRRFFFSFINKRSRKR